MAALAFVEVDEGKVKKSSLEAVSYATAIDASTTAIVFGKVMDSEFDLIGKSGATNILHVSSDEFSQVNSLAYASAIAEAIQKNDFKLIVMAKSSLADPIAARVAVKTSAALVSNVAELPQEGGGFIVKQSIYTGKAFAMVVVNGDRKVLVIKKNAIPVKEDGGKPIVAVFSPTMNTIDQKITFKSIEKATGEILLPEADIVVSGGRGLKGPENWGMILDLAKVLGAATGCSKPVSDMDWRPHHEHVGQTGVKVAPSLYVAIGISGAIQHLAGVNSSKNILVINKDPESPFFKAADYGIVGDAFDVVPRLTEAIKAAKS